MPLVRPRWNELLLCMSLSNLGVWNRVQKCHEAQRRRAYSSRSLTCRGFGAWALNSLKSCLWRMLLDSSFLLVKS